MTSGFTVYINTTFIKSLGLRYFKQLLKKRVAGKSRVKHSISYMTVSNVNIDFSVWLYQILQLGNVCCHENLQLGRVILQADDVGSKCASPYYVIITILIKCNFLIYCNCYLNRLMITAIFLETFFPPFFFSIFFVILVSGPIPCYT